MKRVREFLWIPLVAIGLAAVFVTAPQALDSADKAEFVIKLIDYVTWPDGKATDASGAVVVSCFGDSPVAAKLKELAAAKAGEGLKLTVKIVAPGDPVDGSQMVYISNCDKAELAKIMKSVGTKPILTIANCPGFAKFGVMVNILDEAQSGGKVKFEVNTITVEAAGLKIGSQLLKLATII